MISFPFFKGGSPSPSTDEQSALFTRCYFIVRDQLGYTLKTSSNALAAMEETQNRTQMWRRPDIIVRHPLVLSRRETYRVLKSYLLEKPHS